MARGWVTIQMSVCACLIGLVLELIKSKMDLLRAPRRPGCYAESVLDETPGAMTGHMTVKLEHRCFAAEAGVLDNLVRSLLHTVLETEKSNMIGINPIETSIDFGANGKQLGYLQLPHSVHRSGYGWIPIPAACIRNGPGVTVLMIAGNHGDEYEGQVVLSHLIGELESADVCGRLIILPMANYPAGEAGLRTSPLDGGNLNRSFPGDPNGTPTQIIAHYIDETLLPMANLLVDLHSGGTSMEYLPSTLPSWSENCRLSRDLVFELSRDMQLPYILLFPEDREARFVAAAALRKGVPSITTETGGGGQVASDYVASIRLGLLRALRRLGCYVGSVLDETPRATTMQMTVKPEHYCFAMEAGVLENLVRLGDRVETGQVVSLIHHPETPGRDPSSLSTQAPGVVVCQRGLARVQRGDCVCHLASELF